MSRAPILRIAAVIAIGGALGALLRASLIDAAGALGSPAWASIVGVNVLGGLAIGVIFVHLEARFLRHARSRLAASPHAPRVESRGWRLDADQTLDPVDLFRAETRMRVQSGYWVTGFLGGFTTFSTFAVELYELAGRTDPGAFAGFYLVAALSPVVATWVGLVIGTFTLPRRGPERR